MSKEYGKYVRGGAPETEKFDINKPYVKTRAYLLPLVWAYCNIRKMHHFERVKKIRMEGVKPPYILLCNHNSFYDFYVMMSAIAPYRAIHPAAVDDYIGREHLLRIAGTVPKRKFTADISLLRVARQALKENQIFGIYAEARYSLCGVTEVIPDAVGQLIKHQKVPVVVLKCMGHHIYDPFWGDHKKRFVTGLQTTMTQVLTPDEIKSMSADEISKVVKDAMYNDDFRWQSENRVKMSYRKRAEGLHKVLYQCPHCMKEFKMNSKGTKIFCEECGKSWTLNEYGELSADSGDTEFKFASDWYKWEREQVRKEVQDGTYYFESECHVNDLPNSKGFVRLGNGKIIHDLNGFRVEGIKDYDGQPFEMKIDSAGQYAVHVEFNYRFGQYKDCIDLNTLDDTWYVFPHRTDCSVTKISLATEEIFNEIWRKRNEEKAAALK